MDMEYWGPIMEAMEVTYKKVAPMILEWFVLEGGEVVELLSDEFDLRCAELKGIQYFIGAPRMMDSVVYAAEIGALITERPLFDEPAIREMVKNAGIELPDGDITHSLEVADEGIWLAMALNHDLVEDASQMGAAIAGLVANAERIVKAVA